MDPSTVGRFNRQVVRHILRGYACNVKCDHIKNPIVYLLASLLIAWHVTAIAFIGPWHRGGEIYDIVQPFFARYIYEFNLNADWRFFAPDPAYLDFSVLRYRLHTANDTEQLRPLTEKLDIYRPTAFRYLMSYSYLSYYPDFLASFSQYLCRDHEHQSPSAVSIHQYRRIIPGKDAILAGARPDDESQLKLIDVHTFSCGGE